MSYRNEFPSDFNLGFELEQFPQLVDQSWHNDACPSFSFRRGNEGYVLWVDYESADSREFQERVRYTIYHGTPCDNTNTCQYLSDYDRKPVLETDCINTLTQFLNEYRPFVVDFKSALDIKHTSQFYGMAANEQVAMDQCETIHGPVDVLSARMLDAKEYQCALNDGLFHETCYA